MRANGAWGCAGAETRPSTAWDAPGGQFDDSRPYSGTCVFRGEAQFAEQIRQVRQSIMRVQPAGVGQHPDHTPRDGRGLVAQDRIRFSEDLWRNMFRRDVFSRFSQGFGLPLVETDVRVRSEIGRRPKDLLA